MLQRSRRIVARKRFFLNEAKFSDEYLYDVNLDRELFSKLRELNIDLFTFIGRDYIVKKNYSFKNEEDNVALLKINSYEDWWRRIGKKTRNMVRKAMKKGVKTEIIRNYDDRIAVGIWRIYNETPIRQGRWFPNYRVKISIIKEAIKKMIKDDEDSELLCALYKDKPIGFISLLYGDEVAVISQILSSIKHLDKAPNNALIAKAVERCAEKKITNLIYARMGNHPSLDRFKRNNGFVKVIIPRYYIPLTNRGLAAIKLGFHRDAKDVLPEKIKYPLIPIYNSLSRIFHF